MSATLSPLNLAILLASLSTPDRKVDVDSRPGPSWRLCGDDSEPAPVEIVFLEHGRSECWHGFVCWGCAPDVIGKADTDHVAVVIHGVTQ